MQPLVYKKVYDYEAHDFYLEVWQGDQHIRLSMAPASNSLEDHQGEAKWEKMKHTIENLKEKSYEQSSLDANSRS